MRLCLFLLFLGGSCHKKTDAERAAEERAEMRKKLDSSLTLVPYRGLFGKERAQLILIRALIERQGGLEKLFCRLLGQEDGQKLFRELTFFHRLEDAVARAPASVGDKAKQGLDAVKALKDKL
jgi:hypothetical protein